MAYKLICVNFLNKISMRGERRLNKPFHLQQLIKKLFLDSRKHNTVTPKIKRSYFTVTSGASSLLQAECRQLPLTGQPTTYSVQLPEHVALHLWRSPEFAWGTWPGTSALARQRDQHPSSTHQQRSSIDPLQSWSPGLLCPEMIWIRSLNNCPNPGAVDLQTLLRVTHHSDTKKHGSWEKGK